MGAWGYKALESDEGLDVVDFLKGEYLPNNDYDWTLAGIIAAMKKSGFFGRTFKSIDFYYDHSAMALTELYFEFCDNGKFDYEDEEAESGLAFGKVSSFTADEKSLSFLLRYLTDIRDEVPDKDGEREIVELWKESVNSEEWKEHLLSLITRLQKAISEATT